MTLIQPISADKLQKTALIRIIRADSRAIFLNVR
jgi:hypothetical protein